MASECDTDGSPSASSYQTAPTPEPDGNNLASTLNALRLESGSAGIKSSTEPIKLVRSTSDSRQPLPGEGSPRQSSNNISEAQPRRDSFTSPRSGPSILPVTPTDSHIAKPVVSPAPPSRRMCVLLQERCKEHVFRRNADIGTIVERPERIRAVKTGVAAAWARLEARNVAHGGVRTTSLAPAAPPAADDNADDELERMMSGLGIREDKGKAKEVTAGPFDILLSESIMSLDAPSLRYVHPAPNRPPEPSSSSTAPSTSSESAPLDLNLPWPDQLIGLCRNASQAIRTPPYSEIPQHLPQGDLYLTEGSEAAILGSLGAVAEGVDRIVAGSRSGGLGYDRAFVVVRPPGHHCCETQPMGFCFVNNVVVAAAHAYQTYQIDRIVILDIDLHHGNGTQDIVWRINEEANRQALAAASSNTSPRKGAAKKPVSARRDLQIFYGSLHDIYSYPCEDGDASMIQAASLQLAGGHSQWISNTHLETFDRASEESHFHSNLYPKYHEGLLGRAAAFCRATSEGDEASMADRTLVIVSAGFDASEHESAGMSRHSRHVPTSFFHRFMRDCCRFANEQASGKVLAVLEGGYSDRALASGALALTVAMTESPRRLERTFFNGGDENSWWAEPALVQLEKGCKARRGKAPAASPATGTGDWLARAVEVFSQIEGLGDVIAPSTATPKDAKDDGNKMQLRERRPRTLDNTPQPTPTKLAAGMRSKPGAPGRPPNPTLTTPARATLSDNTLDVPAPTHPVNYQTREHESQAMVIPEAAQVPPPKIKFTWKQGGI